MGKKHEMLMTTFLFIFIMIGLVLGGIIMGTVLYNREIDEVDRRDLVVILNGTIEDIKYDDDILFLKINEKIIDMNDLLMCAYVNGMGSGRTDIMKLLYLFLEVNDTIKVYDSGRIIVNDVLFQESPIIISTYLWITLPIIIGMGIVLLILWIWSLCAIDDAWECREEDLEEKDKKITRLERTLDLKISTIEQMKREQVLTPQRHDEIKNVRYCQNCGTQITDPYNPRCQYCGSDVRKE